MSSTTEDLQLALVEAAGGLEIIAGYERLLVTHAETVCEDLSKALDRAKAYHRAGGDLGAVLVAGIQKCLGEATAYRDLARSLENDHARQHEEARKWLRVSAVGRVRTSD